jgi:protein-tyrosine phosphatase
MRRVAKTHGLKYSGRAKQFKRGHFDQYDLIIAMDSNNFGDLQRLARSPNDERKIHMLREFDPKGGKTKPVPDPYYGGIRGFEETFLIVERSCRGLLDAIESGQVKV